MSRQPHPSCSDAFVFLFSLTHGFIFPELLATVIYFRIISIIFDIMQNYSQPSRCNWCSFIFPSDVQNFFFPSGLYFSTCFCILLCLRSVRVAAIYFVGFSFTYNISSVHRTYFVYNKVSRDHVCGVSRVHEFLLLFLLKVRVTQLTWDSCCVSYNMRCTWIRFQRAGFSLVTLTSLPTLYVIFSLFVPLSYDLVSNSYGHLALESVLWYTQPTLFFFFLKWWSLKFRIMRMNSALI